MKDYEQFESTVLKYIKDNFTAPFFIKTDDYEIGTVLYTANPYYRTNATIIDITKSIGTFYTVLTDIGNILYENKKTLEENYLPPVCKRTNSLLKIMKNILNYHHLVKFQFILQVMLNEKLCV